MAGARQPKPGIRYSPASSGGSARCSEPVAFHLDAHSHGPWRPVKSFGRITCHPTTGRLVPPLLMLDEIANWSPLPDLPTWVSGLGGSGIPVVAVFQSRAQMEDTWGEKPRR